MFINKFVCFSETFKNPQETIDLLNNGIEVFGLYVIYIDKSTKSNCLIEFFLSSELFKPFNQKKDLEIIALANSKREAIDIVAIIISLNINYINNARKFKSNLNLNF